jgi:hypothetical protein
MPAAPMMSRWIEGQIVEHDVAVVDTEGRAAVEHAADDILAQIGKLVVTLGLRIGNE